MKRFFALVLLVLVMGTSALAESIVSQEYTDAPTVMTQDSVVELFTDEEECLMETLQPDELSVALLNNVYQFVYIEKNRPARYYDEETQKRIAELAGCDIDILHMTEAMRLLLTGEPEEDVIEVTATMRLDVDYRVDQLVVVVLGIPQEDGEYIWYPYRGRVETLGEIKWDMPTEDWKELAGQPISFHVLTDRIGPRGERIWHEEQYKDHYDIFSKDSGDVNVTRRWYSESGEVIEDNFRLWLVDLTGEMQDEVLRIGEHVAEGKSVIEYFPEERMNEARLMLPVDVAPSELLTYDIVALRAEEYKDTYGDVNAEIVFATVYDYEKAMVVFAGFPVKDAQEQPYFEWFVFRAKALPDGEAVDIGFKQLNLPRMEEEPIMLVVISENLEEIPENTDTVPTEVK